MTKPKYTLKQSVDILAERIIEITKELTQLKKELRILKHKHENKTIGGFNDYVTPKEMYGEEEL